MGCTPSKSAVIYSQDKVCRDLDTCSTFVPSLKSSVSTPERPRLGLETSNGRQTYLSVPCRSVHARSVSLSSTPECWGSSPPCSSLSAGPISVKPRCQTPEPHGACSDLQ
ncbi:hypothetical protein NQZ68_004126 [Dissostichus eleginoides]|uniref:Leucine aminopeptidase 2 n=1 Tax=Dissostichus eleginoides TaxID=100907 RepID=A0AAD9CIP1_DISEL|nr:hypothetical protein NQZ68_004126 [Dissostichus eleginoides]KAK1902424.1 Leucine aminopeptidase 2 [Dissostichus eleginoides]